MLFNQGYRIKAAIVTVELNKKALSEQDICLKFITPAIVAAGWDPMLQMRQEVSFTAGRILVRGKEVFQPGPRLAHFQRTHLRKRSTRQSQVSCKINVTFESATNARNALHSAKWQIHIAKVVQRKTTE